MSKTRKIIIVLALVLILTFAYSINVKAATMSNLVDWNVATSEGNEYTLNANNNGSAIKQDIVIQNGENVVLDLNGQTLTNFTDGCSTITVENGGILTVSGTGIITNTSNNNVPTITNNGTLTIVGGNITSNNTNYATCILNNGTVEVNGGTITTTTQKCWGLTNSGTAKIQAGTFEQKGDFSVIMNAGDMTISGGTINVTSGYSAITNESADGNSASLKVTDVTVTGAKYIISNPGDEEVAVTGGTFGTDSNISEILGDSYIVDENGEVVEAPENPDTPTPEEPSDDEDLTEEKPTDEEITDNEVVETPDVDSDVNETDGEVSENPKTGDTIIVFATIFVVAIVGLVVTLKAKKKMK